MRHEATPIESGIFTSLSRAAWSIFLCMVIYACVKGYGGPVNWFLSLPLWQPFARLTYAIYLVHMPIMVILSASVRRPLYFSGRNIVSSMQKTSWNNTWNMISSFIYFFFHSFQLFKYMGDFTAATILSIFVSLALESPIVVLEKVIFGSKKKPNIIPTTQRDEPTAPAQESTWDMKKIIDNFDLLRLWQKYTFRSSSLYN